MLSHEIEVIRLLHRERHERLVDQPYRLIVDWLQQRLPDSPVAAFRQDDEILEERRRYEERWRALFRETVALQYPLSTDPEP